MTMTMTLTGFPFFSIYEAIDLAQFDTKSTATVHVSAHPQLLQSLFGNVSTVERELGTVHIEPNELLPPDTNFVVIQVRPIQETDS